MRRYIEFKGFNGVSIMAYARVLKIDVEAIKDSMEEHEEVLFLEEQHYYYETMPVLFFGRGASAYNYKDMTNTEGEIVIAEETSRNYGFVVRDGMLYVTANGHIAPYTILEGRYNYCHNFKRQFRKFINSGVEFECYRPCDADVFVSLFDGIPVPYYDGSLDGGAEFKMRLSTFIKVLEQRMLKQEFKVDSTHFHVSSKPVLYNTLLKRHKLNELLYSMKPEDVKKTFGRYYNRFCVAGTSVYTNDRYYAITVPDYDRLTDGNGNVKFKIYSDRVTVEFRAPRIKNIRQFNRFLKFIAKEIVGLENVDNSYKQLIKLIANAPYGNIYFA